ncbi:hypothetical protein [Ornithinimicrobium faecis]|uniref:Uncharacterized protein n=1 Tax=Ornithinimicrobium faecis TaxID=2934158 RepID=A0ABY4YV87_9MICO|nr:MULTISPECIES: hypothetical protein [unclassified Ornithinimicrobium]USQ80654.1 hypothetical protein NF556_03055 [Ornithinimicrobium sp. HY1793]
MEWAALTLALVLILGLALARALRDRRKPSGPHPAEQPRRRLGDPELTPQDEAELTREFAAVAEESGHTLDSLLELRVRVLTSRRVPLRAIRAAPGPHTGRLAFADSTVLLARARQPGELYRLALALPDHAITIDSWSHEQDGTVLSFTWPQERAELLVIGLDQAD